MTLAFFTTSFFVRRELRARGNDRSRVIEIGARKEENRRAGQVVSIALAQSFAVALLFSFMFESSIVDRRRTEDVVLTKLAKQKPEHSIEGPAAEFHHEPYILGLLPREARCDLSRIGIHRKLEFYPTLILSWTALGLFFGVFLEGFLKGERLRGET
jgi:hypothetical protein